MKTSKIKSLKNRIRRLRFDHAEMTQQELARQSRGSRDRPSSRWKRVSMLHRCSWHSGLPGCLAFLLTKCFNTDAAADPRETEER